MTNHTTLFSNIMTFVHRCSFAFHDIRIFTTFGWAIVGLLHSGKPHLSHWVPFRRGEATAASKQRQFSRWLHNSKIQPMAIYHKIIKHILAAYVGEVAYLALDTTQLWQTFVIVRLGLVYRGRAIPLGWQVLASGNATVAVAKYQQMVRQVAGEIPTSTKVILLADRGFGHISLMQLATELGWHFRIRLKRNIGVYHATRRRRQVGALIPPVGQGVCYEYVWLTEREFGPLYLIAAHVLTPQGTEQWAIISDEPVGCHTLDEYGLRFTIEENFRDDKSGGFNLEASGLTDAQALSRLCLITATATVYLVSTGVAVTSLGFRCWVDTHWHRGLSYFQIGWRWCRYALANQKWLHPYIWLPADPDPDPPIASWKQFYQPLFELHALERL